MLPSIKGARAARPYNERMDDHERRLSEAVEATYVVRPPRQALATFGTTTVRYYLVTEPLFREVDARGDEETVVREGVVRAERPHIVTPAYLMRHEGFGDDARSYIESVMRQVGPDAPGLLYTYNNESMETSIVSGGAREVTGRIVERLDREQKPLEAVIRGVDDLWDVSLMKFIYELTARSARSNASELRSHGLLETEGGVPRDARLRIDGLLEQAQRGNVDPSEVHREIERWDLFEEYQDRFLGLFKHR